jgi:hypothetical protein
MENNNCKNINSQIVEDNIGEKKKISFESMMKKVNHRFNTNTNSPLNKKDANILKDKQINNTSIPLSSKNKRKISFIDEKDKTKSIKEVIEIKSYKEFYIDASEENKNKGCECYLF